MIWNVWEQKLISVDRKQKIKLGIMLSSLVIAILEDCRRRAQLLHRPGIAVGPHWRGVQTPPQGSPQASSLLSVVLWAGCSWVRCLCGVWRRRIVHSGGVAAPTQTLCVICEFHVDITTLEVCRNDYTSLVCEQLLQQPWIEPRPHWPEAKHLTSTP